jgi:hypothetical protein
MTEAISSAAMDVNAAQLSQDYAIAVTKKVMDTQEIAGQEMTRMLQTINTPAASTYVDIYA